MSLNKAPQNVLLAAAFAGLSTSAHAATVLTETTDFSNVFTSPTDLTSTFSNFLADCGIIGSINDSGDFADRFTVSMMPNAIASIPVLFSVAENYYVEVLNSSRNNLAGVSAFSSDPAIPRNLNFTVPADGLVTFSVSQEEGNSTMSYTIGTVPEPGSSALTIAGLAAAALRRRRK